MTHKVEREEFRAHITHVMNSRAAILDRKNPLRAQGLD